MISAYRAAGMDDEATYRATLLALSGAGRIVQSDGGVLMIPPERFDLVMALPLWAETETAFGAAVRALMADA